MTTEDDPVPVGPRLNVELDDVGYGAEDDVTTPIAELVDDSEVADDEYGGMLKLDAVKEKLPVPVGPYVELLLVG